MCIGVYICVWWATDLVNPNMFFVSMLPYNFKFMNCELYLRYDHGTNLRLQAKMTSHYSYTSLKDVAVKITLSIDVNCEWLKRRYGSKDVTA